MTYTIKDFQNISSRKELSDLINVSYNSLLLYTVDPRPDQAYTTFNIKKKNGNLRQIFAPANGLKIIQLALNLALQDLYSPKPSTHGFLPKRSILTNAKIHTGKRYVFNTDLKDFFPSINFGRVRGMFMAKPYEFSSEISTILAQICCYNNMLPQGAPTSPIVSNMICAKLDSQLQKLAKDNNCSYSRYADDITISTTSREFPALIAVTSNGQDFAGEQLVNIIKSNGFKINHAKSRLQNTKQRQEVTGLTVNKFVNIRRNFTRQIRAMLNAWEKYGLEKAELEHFSKYDKKHRAYYKNPPPYQSILAGKIEYLSQIKGKNNSLYQQLKNRFQILIGEPPSTELSIRDMTNAAVWILECEEVAEQGTAFNLEGVGLVTCYHTLGKATHAFQASAPSIKYPIKIIKKNEDLDLAILQIDAPIKFAFKQRPEPELEHQDSVTVIGYPNYRIGDTAHIMDGVVTSKRTISSITRLITSARIVAGNSGGPVLDNNNFVIGIAATGSKTISTSEQTEFHSIIPIHALKYLN